MTVENKHPFDVEAFLTTVDGGRTISMYRKNQTVDLPEADIRLRLTDIALRCRSTLLSTGQIAPAFRERDRVQGLAPSPKQ
jgi:hypothetical protein